MVEFVLFAVPVLVYVVVQARSPDRTWSAAWERVGASRGSARGYGWALVLLPVLLVAAWGSLVLVPAEVFEAPGVSVARVSSVAVATGVVLRAAGEEIFFRGLLGGVLMRRLGFFWGNLLQAALFLIPHLPLLLVDVRLLPLLPVQFLTGWLLGWLRHRTGSFVPGAVLHAAVNLTVASITL